MYVSMKELLGHANDNQYAVMAVNCINMEAVKACVESAEEERSSIIINISPRQMRVHGTPEAIIPMVISLANKATVPIALNLDHGKTQEEITSALNMGFSSVMIDASAYEFEENLKRTSMVVRMAHGKNISCEGELGHVGDAMQEDADKEDFFTNVEQALRFVEETNIDCLAVAIGTAHGNYPEGRIPKLDFDRLKELKSVLNIPLVLHGGSGAGNENIKKAVALGINKINVNTDLMNHAVDAISRQIIKNQRVNYMDLCVEIEDAMKTFIKSYMRMIGSSNQYQMNELDTKEFD